MELQNLVKVMVRTLDPEAEPVEVTVASRDGYVPGEHVFNKVCDILGLKPSSRPYFTLLEKQDQPTHRYRLKEDIPVAGSDLYLAKWCFVSSREKDLIHVDPMAAHLVFLQAQHDVHTGKFDLSEEEQQKLEDCVDPGFEAEDQYVLLCQKQTNYNCLYVPQCRLLATVNTPAAVLENGKMVDVIVSKYGVKLVADTTVSFTWFEVSRWTVNKEQLTLTFIWQPDEQGEPNDVPLSSPQVDFLLAGILEMITILQKSDKSEASFHAEMITVGEGGHREWENGLYDPAQARNVKYTV